MRKTAKPDSTLQQTVFRSMLRLVVVMTICVTALSLYFNIREERISLDRNLQNMADAIAQSPIVENALLDPTNTDADSDLRVSLNTLRGSLSDIDVISVVDAEGIRRYHTNQSLLGTTYDGTMPDFETHERIYVTNDRGPSGYQRRAYARITDENGQSLGFVLAVLLNKNINHLITRTILIYLVSAVVIITIAFFLSRRLSRHIKSKLQGYEPDTFRSMFRVREDILDSLEEGILAVGEHGNVVYANPSAKKMLLNPSETNTDSNESLLAAIPTHTFQEVMEHGSRVERIAIRPSNNRQILLDGIPVQRNQHLEGGLFILVDRTEYTKVMEDLSGSKYLVESMRANNHDFTNKLHVILGLIQMGCTKEATEYITSITSIQQKVIHNIMENIDDPSIAALLIGKYARAVELNIHFSLTTGSCYHRSDVSILQGDLVTIIGNLLENAMDSLNVKESFEKELSIRLNTTPGALLITVDDTGCGMSEEVRSRIFENNFSTKEGNRGTGLFVVKQLVEKYNGSIEVESEEGEGTSFLVRLAPESK